MRRALTILLVVVAACGGSPSTGSNSPGSGSAAPSGAAGEFPDLEPAEATTEAVAEAERLLIRRTMVSSGAEAVLGPGLVDAAEEARQELLAELADASTAGARVASTNLHAAPPADLAIIEGETSVVVTLTEQIASQSSSSGGPLAGSRTIDRTSTVDGITSRTTGSSSMNTTSTSSTLSGTYTYDVTMNILDANGRVTDTIFSRIEAKVDLEICPDANGVVKATYTYDLKTEVVGGTTVTFHSEGTVEGLVGDDAFLQSYTVEASGTESSTGSGGGGPWSRGTTSRGGYILNGAPGVTTSTATAIPPVTTITQVDPLATSDDYFNINRESMLPAHWMSMRLMSLAQGKWRSGACMKIESSEPGRDVEPDEQVPFTARVIHKIENVELDKPVVATLTGVQAIDPAGTEVPAPADFTFTGGPDFLDIGDVHLKTTSNRGIAELDIRFVVMPPLFLELKIESELHVTQYVSYATDVTFNVDGRIRLKRDAETGLWSGTGQLHTMSFDSSPGGCHSATFLGNGDYDWVVKDVVASPGLPTDQIKIWMDAGTIVENPDSYTSYDCPSSTFHGVANVWENLFFLLHLSNFGQSGFLVDDLGGGDTTTPWRHGQDLGGIGWLASCELNLPENLRRVNSCELSTDFTLFVVDGHQAPP